MSDIPKFAVTPSSDPLSAILSTEVYVMVQEKLHPNIPLTDVLKQLATQVTSEQRAFIVSRAKMVRELSDAVTKTFGAIG